MPTPTSIHVLRAVSRLLPLRRDLEQPVAGGDRWEANLGVTDLLEKARRAIAEL
jgi:hypothetical protein